MPNIIQILRNVLQESIDSTPEQASRFFKTNVGEYAERDQFMGISVPKLRRMAKEFRSLNLEDLELLLQSSINEERLLALIILTAQYKTASIQHKERIYEFYKSHIFYVNNWNLVDSSAHHIMGAHLFERDRCDLAELARSHNLWERRISIVSTWYFIRKQDLAWTFKISALLKNDPQDLIHKAVGWMLREAGKQNLVELIQFLNQHMSDMPRTMLRYAIEKLPEAQRKSYLIKS